MAGVMLFACCLLTCMHFVQLTFIWMMNEENIYSVLCMKPCGEVVSSTVCAEKRGGALPPPTSASDYDLNSLS